nr:NUDIX hydrolase [Actinokineospora enzanensis]
MQPLRLAGCVIPDPQGRLLMLHRRTASLTQWEIPGGKLERDEEADAAARRELLEETGVEVHIERELGSTEFQQNGRCMVYTWFLASIPHGRPRPVEADVHDRCDFLGIDQLLDMPDALSPNVRKLIEELNTGRIIIAATTH